MRGQHTWIHLPIQLEWFQFQWLSFTISLATANVILASLDGQRTGPDPLDCLQEVQIVPLAPP